MNTLHSFMHEVSLGFSSSENSFKAKSQEKDFALFLGTNGFNLVDKKSVLGGKIKGLKSLTYDSSLKGMFLFVQEPFGSQRQPDFIIIIDGWVLWLELKRSKGKKISWNTGFPKDDVLYIFDSQKLGRIMFFGRHHSVYGGKEKEYLDITGEISKYAKKAFEPTGINYYNRKMLIDAGEYKKEDLFNKLMKLVLSLNNGVEA